MTLDNSFNTKHFRTILNKYENMVKKGEKSFWDSDDLIDIAEYYQSIDEPNKAIGAIDYALHLYPGSAELLALKARMTYYSENNLTKAQAILNQVEDTNDVEYVYAKGEFMVIGHHAKKADLYFDKMMSHHEEIFEDYVLDVARIFCDYQEMEYVEKWLALSNLHDDNDYLEMMARVRINNDDFESAIGYIDTLIDKEPYSVTYWNLMAKAHFHNNDLSDSITASEYALAIDPNNEEALLNKAQNLLSLKNFDGAIKCYEKHCQLFPESEIGEMFIGTAYVQQNNQNEAIIHLEKSLSLCKKDEQSVNKDYILHELLLLENNSGNRQKAEEYLKMLSKSKTNKSNIDIIKGELCLGNDDQEKASIHFQEALEKVPNTDTLFHVALAYYDNFYFEKAKGILELLFKYSDEDWTEGYAYHSRCCYEMGDMTMYRKSLEHALKVNISETMFVLSDLYPEGTKPEDYLKTAPISNKK